MLFKWQPATILHGGSGRATVINPQDGWGYQPPSALWKLLANKCFLNGWCYWKLTSEPWRQFLSFQMEPLNYTQICLNSLTVLSKAQFVSLVLFSIAVACKCGQLAYCLHEFTLPPPTIFILMSFCASVCLPDWGRTWDGFPSWHLYLNKGNVMWFPVHWSRPNEVR